MAMVSMHSSDVEAPRLPECERLALCFDDLIVDTDWGVTPNLGHIKLITGFIHGVQDGPQSYLLVCQCDGGCSRSGAVGEFAAMLAGIPGDKFLKENPRVFPNRLMRELFKMNN